jgi:D-alanine-D-alanine ligase
MSHSLFPVFDHDLSQQRIVLLCGGNSAEREISLRSGENVERALRSAGCAPTILDPREQTLDSIDWAQQDLAFIALHGTFGEDGAIQQQLDALNICYTGSGPQASATAFHKLTAKKRFRALRLPTPTSRAVPPHAPLPVIQRLASQIGYPIIVKPDAQGSSLGVSLLHDASTLASACELARGFGTEIFLERAIPGEEWTVPVLDDAALPPIRISTSRPFFEFSAKYLDKETRYDVIHDPHDPFARQVQQLSLQACRAIGCRGLSRVDLRVDPCGHPWLLEINTVPGLTAQSLVPRSAEMQGWDMATLCQQMIRSAMRIRSGWMRRGA